MILFCNIGLHLVLIVRHRPSSWYFATSVSLLILFFNIGGRLDFFFFFESSGYPNFVCDLGFPFDLILSHQRLLLFYFVRSAFVLIFFFWLRLSPRIHLVRSGIFWMQMQLLKFWCSCHEKFFYTRHIRHFQSSTFIPPFNKLLSRWRFQQF